MIRIHAIASVLASLLLSSVVNAQAFVPDLLPGSTYHLAFVTDEARDATSADISVYDAFVNAQADQRPDLEAFEWSAYVATPAAPLNRFTSQAPIYLVTGQRIADSLSDSPVFAPVPGAWGPLDVWVGKGFAHVPGDADLSGEPESFCPLGNVEPVCVYDGAPFSQRVKWSGVGSVTSDFQPQASRLSILAVSPLLTVPIPESTSSTLLLIGIAVSTMAIRQRRAA